jgi:ADP-L-glycero-D-manno-heptose 6-epimerase
VNVIVTGGTGFVGRAVADLYIKEGHQVFITGREAPLPGAVFLGPDFQTIDWSTLPTIDICNHQAAITDPQHPDPDEVMRVNLRETLDFFHDAAKHGIKKIVYASSAAVYGNVQPPFREAGPVRPLTAYGVSKLCLDRMIDVVPPDVSVVGLRYSNVWGPGERHKGKLASMIRQIGVQMMLGERPKLYWSGHQRRDWIHIDDVARANVLAGSVTGREVFNIGQGWNESFNDLVNAWNFTLHKNLQPEYIENPYSRTYQSQTLLDINKAKLMGWQPQKGLLPALEAYRRHLRHVERIK